MSARLWMGSGNFPPWPCSHSLLGLSCLIWDCKAPQGDKGPFALIPRVILPADRTSYLPSRWECRRVRHGAASSNPCWREALPERWDCTFLLLLARVLPRTCPVLLPHVSSVQGKSPCREWKRSKPSVAAPMSASEAFPFSSSPKYPPKNPQPDKKPTTRPKKNPNQSQILCRDEGHHEVMTAGSS